MDFALNTYSDDEASYIFCLRNSITGNLSLKEEEYHLKNSKEMLELEICKSGTSHHCHIFVWLISGKAF